MNVFHALRDLVRPRPAPKTTSEGYPLPYGLSEGQVRALRSLVATEEFDVFLSALDVDVKLYGEALLGSSTDENVHFYRGFISGIRHVATLVPRVLQAEQAFIADKRRQENGGSKHDRLSALWGTPGWSKPSKL